MKNYTLVIVSGRTVVAREYKSVTVELLHEAAACTAIMNHTLVLRNSSVIFEHHRGEAILEESKEGYAALSEVLKKGKEIRVLTDRENQAVARVC